MEARPKAPSTETTVTEMTTLEKIWGKLFKEGKPTKRLGQLLHSIAVHLVSMDAVDWRNFAADSVKDPGGILKVSQSHQMRNKRLPDGAVGLGFHDDHKMTGQTKWAPKSPATTFRAKGVRGQRSRKPEIEPGGVSYLKLLNKSEGLAYMTPVSPWFYTNLPGYGKNWLWRGDHLWHDR
ncbi:uncharacterized protein Aud_002317 [Aspergillus udagawae]|uniref:Uncharacterized protein n=1 Tax=Aspergillus udagawae TaxID=91492 RepID=A0A8E0QNM3_9EURO|nr:uncharacterized protein Aud_002317 [Aspergillus udagawae]GIC85958.1 hypothetical protein Aud_002317 [Aspergillus udagawae]